MTDDMRGTIVRIALVAVLGGGGCMTQPKAPQNCAPTPPDGTLLSIHDEHDFGKHYDVFEVLVKIDGCIFFRSDDTRMLSRTSYDIPAMPVWSGTHQLEVGSKYRSGFSADMHEYEWYSRGAFEVEIAPGRVNSLAIRRTEVMNKDPRARVETNITLKSE